MNSKFSYGDAIIIKQNAPQNLHPGEFGSICSINQVTSNHEAEKFKCRIGEWLYTVEFENGSDIQISECYLDKDLGIIRGKELSEHNNLFTNGTVLNIQTNLIKNIMTIQIQSAFIREKSLNNLLLSEDGYLKGNIIVTQINDLRIHNNYRSTRPESSGTILSFEISDSAGLCCIIHHNANHPLLPLSLAA